MIVPPLIVSALRGEYREKPARETRTWKKEAGTYEPGKKKQGGGKPTPVPCTDRAATLSWGMGSGSVLLVSAHTKQGGGKPTPVPYTDWVATLSWGAHVIR